MTQSSVDWLMDKLKFVDKNAYNELYEYYEQAKVMHEQEHEDAYIEGGNCISNGWAWTIEGRKDMAGIHYTETFGKSEQ